MTFGHLLSTEHHVRRDGVRSLRSIGAADPSETLLTCDVSALRASAVQDAEGAAAVAGLAC